MTEQFLTLMEEYWFNDDYQYLEIPEKKGNCKFKYIVNDFYGTLENSIERVPIMDDKHTILLEFKVHQGGYVWFKRHSNERRLNYETIEEFRF